MYGKIVSESICLVVLLSAGLVAESAGQGKTQPKSPPAPKAAPTPAKKPAAAAKAPPAAKAPAAQAPLSEADQKAKQALLQSDRWRQAISAMNEWLSVQQVYTPQQVEALKTELAGKVELMSPAEVQTLLDRMEAKLAVLLSPEAQSARDWVAQYMSVVAASRREELKKKLPDPVSMTPAQMQQELAAFQQRQASKQQAQAALQQGREQRVQSIRSSRTQVAPTGQARGTGSASAHFGPVQQSQFAPRQYNPGFMNRPTFYMTPWGEVGRSFSPSR